MNSMTEENGSIHKRRRGLKILQHNMQRSKIVPLENKTQMKVDGDEILLTQEPYGTEGKIPGLGTGVTIACRGSKRPANGSGRSQK